MSAALGSVRTDVNSLIAPLRTVQGALGTIGVGIGLSRIRQMVTEVGQIGNVADKVSLTTHALQELRFASEEVGVSAGTMDTAMQRFARRIAEVAAGANNDLAQVLKANNVQLRDQEGNLRRQEDLLADYADLIKNARNEQDRLRLAFIAFDSEGAAMVNALKEGADGLERSRQEARDLGIVIEKDIIDRADELDRKWSETWQQFRVRGVAALVALSEGAREFKSEMDGLADAAADLWNDPSFRNLSRYWFGEQATNMLFGKDADARIRDAFSGEEQQADERLAEALRKRYGDSTREATDIGTIIPDKETGRGGGSRSRAISELEKQQRAIDNVIKALEHEFSLIGKSETQKRIMNELRKAGADATTEEGRRIAELVEQIETQNAAIEREKELLEGRQEAYSNLFELGGDAIQDLIDKSEDGEEALKRLGVQLAVAAAQAALLGSGPLAGLLGGGGLFSGGGFSSSGLSSLPSGAIGLFDRGGYTGDGSRSDVAGLVHRKEYVVDADATAKYRPILDAMNAGRNIGMFNMRPMMEAGSAGGGGEITLRVIGQEGPMFRPTIRAESEDVAVRVSGQALSEYDGALPDRVQQINRRPRMR
ncbi:hypothetical protein [Chelativorans sp. YIM 93263]|uniref:hypothetical protein n=1 Tax=Chelativorans sp. YIM 93263 TaxID=2906648 RepID=UPI002379D5F5|nr:hypothetical protein [Chelativorans sp. YIM 93263]